jgi:hypothetical protein
MMVNLESVTLTGAQETALATLYGKAMESRQPDSILGDREADEAMQRLDYDFGRLRMRRRDLKSAAVRAKSYDWWVSRFLDSCPECRVLHLGCGLDTRAYRINPPSTIGWYDVDLPDVIALRRRLFPGRPGLHTVAASVTDAHLLDEIPGDKPVLFVAEGLTCFPRGELVFDGYSRLGVWLTQRYGPVKATGAQLDWSIGDPHDLEQAVPGLVFDSEWWFANAPEIEQHYSRLYRQVLRSLFRITVIRRLGRGLRYHFGDHHA